MTRQVTTWTAGSRQVEPYRPPCTRCAKAGAFARWGASSMPALKTRREFQLCTECVAHLLAFLGECRGDDPPLQRAADLPSPAK